MAQLVAIQWGGGGGGLPGAVRSGDIPPLICMLDVLENLLQSKQRSFAMIIK